MSDMMNQSPVSPGSRRKTYHAPNGNAAHSDGGAEEEEVVEQTIAGRSAVDQLQCRGGSDEGNDVTQGYKAGIIRERYDVASVLEQ
jgi:hypothetical protein